MPTSGTYGFAMQADDVLTEAWQRIGFSAEILTSTHAKSALTSLALIMIDWTNAGLNLWQCDRVTVSVPAGTATIATAAGTTDILEATVNQGGADLGLAPLGRSEWMALTNKAQAGRPTQYWTERVNLVPVIHLWPVPEVAYSLTYSRIRMPQDLSALSQTPDTPALWLAALCAELAARLAEKFAPDREAAMLQKAERAFLRASTENRERVPFRIIPAFG